MRRESRPSAPAFDGEKISSSGCWMSAVDVGGLGRRAKVTSLSVALRGRLAPITARIGALALAVFLRPLLALVLARLVVPVASFLVPDVVLRDTLAARGGA